MSGRATAILACALAAAPRVDGAETVLRRGVVIERVNCEEQPAQSYALYLPSAYSPDRSWPILLAFDPGAQGARPVRLAAESAERFGWIVAGSNNSRNGPMAEIQAAVAALTRDAMARFPVDPRRVYATGLSGGARVAASLAMSCRGCIAGVFAQGAGLPTSAASAEAPQSAWFASAGVRDMNFGELFVLEQDLRKRGARERLRVFEGGHEWAPPAVWSEAFEWFELLAMNEGRRPRDAALTAALFEKASARAAAFAASGELVEQAREEGAIARDFAGLADTAPAAHRFQELAASSAYKKALERERDAVAEQARLALEVHVDVARLLQAPSDDHAELVLRATRDASGLVRGLEAAREPARRLAYERARSQVFVEAMETARGALRQGRPDSALALFDVAGTLRPELASTQLGRAQALAAAGRRSDAVRALGRALELGTTPAELARLLEANDAFAKLREIPEARALAAPAAVQP